MNLEKYKDILENIIFLYLEEELSYAEIGRKFNLSLNTIKRILKFVGYKKHIRNRIPKNIKEEIINLYNLGDNSTKISKKFNITRSAVIGVLKQQNQKIRTVSESNTKYSFNKEFFEEINTEEKAYFLGFILADGCISNNRVTVCIQEDDIEILEMLKNSLNSNNPILLKKKMQPTHKNQVKISITSNKMVKDLAKYGVVQAKSLITYFPEIPEEFHSHFIRGVFDGDGCISINFSIVGNFKLIDKMQDILVKKCQINKTKISLKGKGKNDICCLVYGGNKQLKRIREYLYKDATIFLKRKKDKFYKI